MINLFLILKSTIIQNKKSPSDSFYNMKLAALMLWVMTKIKIGDQVHKLYFRKNQKNNILRKN